MLVCLLISKVLDNQVRAFGTVFCVACQRALLIVFFVPRVFLCVFFVFFCLGLVGRVLSGERFGRKHEDFPQGPAVGHAR